MLLVRGKLSDLVTEVQVSEFLERYPNASFADVSGAGHMVVGDKNDVCLLYTSPSPRDS